MDVRNRVFGDCDLQLCYRLRFLQHVQVPLAAKALQSIYNDAVLPTDSSHSPLQSSIVLPTILSWLLQSGSVHYGRYIADFWHFHRHRSLLKPVRANTDDSTTEVEQGLATIVQKQYCKGVPESFNCSLGHAGTFRNRLGYRRCIWIGVIHFLNDPVHTADCLCNLFDCVARPGN